MPARLKLYVDWFNKRLLKGPSNEGQFILPKFFQGDTVPMQVQILEPNPSGAPNSFVTLDIGSMALKLGVGDTPTGTAGGPAPFVTQFTWSKNTNENYFYADVAFNTAGVDTFLGTSASKEAYLELEITEGAAVATVFQGKITLLAEVIEAASLAVAPGETPLSMEVALQMFASKIMAAGETLTFISPDGTRRRILGCNNDGSGQDDVL